MIELSRRAFLGSSAALAGLRFPSLSVVCSLEESRSAFRELQSFTGVAAGGPVLVESSVGFATENLAWLRRWGISIHESIAVRGPAWVRFHWPISVMIRDFGRASPISGGSVIARLNGIPVAVRKGPLVVLGSPLGPHLYAGDREARALLHVFSSLPRLGQCQTGKRGVFVSERGTSSAAQQHGIGCSLLRKDLAT